MHGIAQEAAVSDVPSVTVVLLIIIEAFVLALDSVTVTLCNVSVAIEVGVPTYI